MKLSGLLLLLILLSTVNGVGQNLLGYDSEEIKKYVKKNHPDLVMETNFKNDHYTYLKYTDGNKGSETIMFFMSNRDRCTSIKGIYDPGEKESLIKRLDKTYKRMDGDIWEDHKRGSKAIITLQEEEWFITLSIKPDK